VGPEDSTHGFALKRDFARKPRHLPEKLQLRLTGYVFMESGFRSLDWGRFQPSPAMAVVKRLITLGHLSVSFRIK
jgi:hypothetical protein